MKNPTTIKPNQVENINIGATLTCYHFWPVAGINFKLYRPVWDTDKIHNVMFLTDTSLESIWALHHRKYCANNNPL